MGDGAGAGKRAPFEAIHRHGFVRVATASPCASAGDVAYNVDQTLALAGEADRRGVDLAIFPELNISSYAVDDLHLQEAFLDSVEAGLARLAEASATLKPVLVVGEEIDIKPAARQMLADMGHPFAKGEMQYDVTFENVQAGLRTDYLFRLANQRGGFVVGTGDLSEIALGWSTYGVGDQMSHYGVNAGVPKTLIQYLIRWAIRSGQFDGATDDILQAILDTKISPELVPADEKSGMQSTEERIGPYELHDFFLFHILRHGQSPSKVAFMAWQAWKESAQGLWPFDYPETLKREYDLATIRKWLEVFLFRFFQISQFKRSAIPNSPKVSAGGALSPRGDWRAPSDGTATVWLDELKAAFED